MTYPPRFAQNDIIIFQTASSVRSRETRRTYNSLDRIILSEHNVFVKWAVEFTEEFGRRVFGGVPEGGKTLMPRRKFQELLDEMPAARRKRIAKRVERALAAMPLEELRRARRKTQVELAQTLGVNQGEVSKIEHRTDVYLSTLAGYVEALGGRLDIRTEFPDREMRISQFEDLAK